MKKMNIKEFRKIGLLQEINRQFLHPLGLALEVIVDEEGEEELGGIWDARDDPEGIIFDDFDKTHIVKATRVQQIKDDKAKARQERLGYVIQPVRLYFRRHHCGDQDAKLDVET